MNWGWLQAAATGGFLTEVGRRLFDFLDKRFEERRTIRAEERVRAYKEADRKREQAEKEAEAVGQDDAHLWAHKTRLKCCPEWAQAVGIVSNIHTYFERRPYYLEISSNQDFLIKYPKDYGPDEGQDEEQWLADLKRDVDSLRVEGGRPWPYIRLDD